MVRGTDSEGGVRHSIGAEALSSLWFAIVGVKRIGGPSNPGGSKEPEQARGQPTRTARRTS